MDNSLTRAVVSSEQILEMSHPLAAANHRQWVIWEQWVLRSAAKLTPEDAGDIVQQARNSGLDDMLARDALMVIGIVKQFVGEFAYAPDVSRVVKRKLDQFSGWVAYATTKAAEDRTRWLLQCRTPFLSLSPDAQVSDYAEAKKDMLAVAEAGGLVLVDPFPTLMPQTSGQLNLLRAGHKLGAHGKYVSSEQSWSMICVGCHRNWSVSR